MTISAQPPYGRNGKNNIVFISGFRLSNKKLAQLLRVVVFETDCAVIRLNGNIVTATALTADGITRISSVIVREAFGEMHFIVRTDLLQMLINGQSDISFTFSEDDARMTIRVDGCLFLISVKSPAKQVEGDRVSKKELSLDPGSLLSAIDLLLPVAGAGGGKTPAGIFLKTGLGKATLMATDLKTLVTTHCKVIDSSAHTENHMYFFPLALATELHRLADIFRLESHVRVGFCGEYITVELSSFCLKTALVESLAPDWQSLLSRVRNSTDSYKFPYSDLKSSLTYAHFLARANNEEGGREVAMMMFCGNKLKILSSSKHLIDYQVTVYASDYSAKEERLIAVNMENLGKLLPDIDDDSLSDVCMRIDEEGRYLFVCCEGTEGVISCDPI